MTGILYEAPAFQTAAVTWPRPRSRAADWNGNDGCEGVNRIKIRYNQEIVIRISPMHESEPENAAHDFVAFVRQYSGDFANLTFNKIF